MEGDTENISNLESCDEHASDLAVKLTETYPNVAVTEDIGSAIDQVKNADVLIISAEPETNSPLAQAVAARAKVTKDRMAVIRL